MKTFNRIFLITLFSLLTLSCKTILTNQYSKGKDKFNNDTLPNIGAFDQDKNRYDLSEINTKVTMINFWGTWCPACLVELPEVNTLLTTLQDDPDIEIVNVCVGCPFDQWQKVSLENNLNGFGRVNLLADSTSSRELYSWINNIGEGFPFNVVLNEKREIIASNVLEAGESQLITVYALLNAKDNWTGNQSFRDFFREMQKKSSKRKEENRFWIFFEEYAKKYVDE